MLEDQIVINFCRLLRRYSLDIYPFTSTSVERTAIKLLRSRDVRTRLAQIISNTRNAIYKELYTNKVHPKDLYKYEATGFHSLLN